MKNQTLTETKFKYNFLERKLWRIEDDYFYEIDEQNWRLEHHLTGIRFTFNLKNGQWLLLSFDDELRRITAYYVKSRKNGELTHYLKKLNPDRFQVEIIIEFSDQDRIEKSEKGDWVPKKETG